MISQDIESCEFADDMNCIMCLRTVSMSSLCDSCSEKRPLLFISLDNFTDSEGRVMTTTLESIVNDELGTHSFMYHLHTYIHECVILPYQQVNVLCYLINKCKVQKWEGYNFHWLIYKYNLCFTQCGVSSISLYRWSRIQVASIQVWVHGRQLHEWVLHSGQCDPLGCGSSDRAG